MKGKLIKTEKGWIVRYRVTTPLSITTETLPLHPKCGIPQYTMCDVLDNGFAEVEFEIVLCSYSKNKDDHYAKLIQNNKSFIDNRKYKLETLAKLLAKTWFHCDWKWESPNERVMQMLMQDLGLYPFKDEDEMIQQTQVDDELYKEASRAVHPYSKLSEDLFENEMINHIGDANKMVEDDVWKVGLEDELNKLPYTKHLDDGQYNDGQLAGFELGATWGYNKAKETLYTEEDILSAMVIGFDLGKNFDDDNPNIGLGWLIYQKDNFIQSLKQPKKD